MVRYVCIFMDIKKVFDMYNNVVKYIKKKEEGL